MVPMGRVLGGGQATDTMGSRPHVQSLPHSERHKSVFILKADDFTKNKAKLSNLRNNISSLMITTATSRLGMKEGSLWVPAWSEREDTNEQGWST